MKDVEEQAFLMKTYSKTLKRLENVYPKAKELTKELILKMKEKVEVLKVINVREVSKYNIILQSHSLVHLLTEEEVKNQVDWAIL